MKGLIVKNAYAHNKSQLSQTERVWEELKALGVDVDIKENFNLAHICDSCVKAKKYDFCVFFDKDKIAARLLEKAGIPLFNSAAAMETCDDKMLTHIALANNGIAMPNCVYAPLCYTESQPVNEEFLSNVENTLHYPLVAKINYGSLGGGVTLIKSRKELYEYEKTNMLLPHFYQEYVGRGVGEDIRVIVVGGKFVCAMKRYNENDFRSNIELGGTGSRYEADDKMISLCEKVASVLKLDYCGVDVLIDNNGNYCVCEVNSNAFFAAAERVCGVNVAKVYAQHIVKNVKKL